MLLAGDRDEEVVTDSWLRAQIGHWIDPKDVEIIRAAVYRFRALVAKSWHSSGVFLVGDAAHQTPPFFGQGMCHGIRDAAQLLWKLQLVRDGVADAKLLDSYQIEREPHVREIISASVAAGTAVCKLDPDEALARDAAFRALEAARDRPVAISDIVPPVRAGLVDPVTGGMRLPEFVVLSGSELRHIDGLLDGRFTLLSLEPTLSASRPDWIAIGGQELVLGVAGAGEAELKDADGRLAAWFTERKICWAIVRPDRYVFAAATSLPDLDAALDTLFIKMHFIRSTCAPHSQIATLEEASPP